MRKKQQITLHKNLQSGKSNAQQQKNQTQNNVFTRGTINDKNSQRTNKKMFSQQKIILNCKNRSSSKSSNNKQSRQVNSSLGKNEKKRTKKKSSQPQSVKGSKKSIKGLLSQQQNLLTSNKRRKNIYTDSDGFNKNNNETKQKRQKQKKRSNKLSNRSSSQSNQQNSFAQSITQSMRSQSQRLDVDSLVSEIKQSQFSNLHKLKLHCLNFIFRNRIIKDQQYDRLYELMVQKFPDKEELFRSILFQILSSLDN